MKRLIVLVFIVCACSYHLDVEAARFAWVGSANTSTLAVSELADALSRGVDEACVQTYPERQYVFYFIGADYMNNKDGTYVYSVGVSLFNRGLQWTTAPVSSYTVSGFRPGSPLLAQRQQLLLEAARETAIELCRQLKSKR